MKMSKWKDLSSVKRRGDIVEVRIRDTTRRTIYKYRFNILDKKAIKRFLQILENFSGISIVTVMKEKLPEEEPSWWE